MRNILLICFICFTLFGCSDKKVTDEMLIGDWECTIIDQTFKLKDGYFQKDLKPETQVKKIKFFIENNTLMTKEIGDSKAVPFDIKKIYETSSFEKTTERGLKFNFTQKVQYISKDKFTLLYITKAQDNYLKKELSISQYKKEVIFERIKN